MLASRSEAGVNGREAPRVAREALTPRAERRLSDGERAGMDLGCDGWGHGVLVLLLAFDLDGDGPDEAEELASERTDDLLVRLATAGERDVAPVKSVLRLPCELASPGTDDALPFLERDT